MNPILIVLLLTLCVVAFVILFGRKSDEEDPEEVPAEEAPVVVPSCPACPACPMPRPCPTCPPSSTKDPAPIRIILETVGGPLAHQNQIVLRENQYRPLYTPVDPSLFLKQPVVKPNDM